jgi:hypothetical protein
VSAPVRPSRTAPWFPLALALCAAAGCCDDEVSIRLEDLQERVSSALCASAVRCGQYPDQQTCEETLGLDYRQLQAAEKAGKIEYVPEQGFSCVKAIEEHQGPGSCSLTVRLTQAPPPACEAAVAGMVAKDQPCFVKNECGSESFCDLSACHAQECCAGSCKLAVRGGGDCSPSGAVCEAGTYCLEKALVCTPKVALGDACTGSAACREGVCLYDAKAQRNVCGLLPGEGKDCAVTEGPRCDLINNYCDPATDKCKRRRGLQEACGSNDECAAFALCDAASGKCVQKGGKGDACAANDDCLGALRCGDGVCGTLAKGPVCEYPNP